MKSIYEYLDYQQFLRDFYEEKKRKKSFFSYRYMGAKLGLDAGYLVKVLQGKLHLSKKSLPKVTRFCSMDKEQSVYFKHLVQFSRAKTEKEVSDCYETLNSFRTRKNLPVLDGNQSEFYGKWYYTAIRSLIGIMDFKDDFENLAKRTNPSINQRQAKAAVRLLENLGLIKKDKKGIYQLSQPIVSTGDKWKHAAIHDYQKQTLELAQRSLEEHPKNQRDISTVTIAVNKEDLPEIREITKEYRRALLTMKTDAKPANCVYQVNVQIFPISQVGDEP